MANYKISQRKLNIGTKVVYTIATGIIAILNQDTHLIIATESAASTDDLVTITPPTNSAEGHIIIARSQTAAEDPTLKDASDNLLLAGDFTLTNNNDYVMLICHNGTQYCEVSRSDNT